MSNLSARLAEREAQRIAGRLSFPIGARVEVTLNSGETWAPATVTGYEGIHIDVLVESTGALLSAHPTTLRMAPAVMRRPKGNRKPNRNATRSGGGRRRSSRKLHRKMRSKSRGNVKFKRTISSNWK